MTDSLLQEVDEALRADKMAQWWQKNRRALWTFAIVAVLATAANSIYQNYREKRGGELLQAFAESQKQLEEGKAADAAAGFGNIAADASGELKDLALIWQSRAFMAENKKDEAIAALKTAAADGNGLWTDIACLRLVGLAPAENACLQNASKSPLAETRAEWSAANLWAKGDTAAALTAIDALIADKDVSPETRERLMQWRATMKPATKAQAAKTEAKEAPPAAKEAPETEGQE